MPKGLAIINFDEDQSAKTREPTISISGPVGVGKSTLIDELRRKYCVKRRVPCFGEPAPIWIVELYYNNPKAFAAIFQAICVTSLGFPQELYSRAGLGFLIERQGWDAVLFSELLLEKQLISKTIFEQISSTVKAQIQQTDYTIVLIAGWLTCHQRIRKRNRKGEELVPVDFCKRLNSKYIEFYKRNFDSSKVFILLAEDSPSAVAKAAENTLNHIRNIQVRPDFIGDRVTSLLRALTTIATTTAP